MANNFKTNKRTELVALRSEEAAAYLTVGSKPYFKDQLEGKRNGTKYTFVIRDAGKYVKGMNLTGQESNLVERPVEMEVQVDNVLIDTNLLEKDTDLEWDKEIATPNGEALVKGVVEDTIASDLGKQNTAFVGTGWLPLFKASNFLESISSESQYAFVDPMVESVVRSAGQAFKPVTDSVEPIFQKGLKGEFAAAQIRGQQGLPNVSISEDLANELASATVTSYTDNADGTATIVLNGVTEDIPAGTPFYIKGVYATDLVGHKTSALKAFIAIEDASAGSVTVRSVDFDGVGTKEACDIKGDSIPVSALPGKAIKGIEAGDYFSGIIRLNGAMEFDTLKKLDWSNAESSVSNDFGVTLHEGRAINIEAGTNKTRWTIASLAGIVEPRAVAYVLVKDKTANLIAQ